VDPSLMLRQEYDLRSNTKEHESHWIQEMFRADVPALNSIAR
jgi:hypothetical protein